MTVYGLAALAADSEIGKAGPIGLLMILLLGVAVLLLARSMLRHLRRVPSSFDQDGVDRDGGDDGTDRPEG